MSNNIMNFYHEKWKCRDQRTTGYSYPLSLKSSSSDRMKIPRCTKTAVCFSALVYHS